MAYEKLLNEIYAVVSLKVSLAGIPAVFCKSEAPDWINETMNLGWRSVRHYCQTTGRPKFYRSVSGLPQGGAAACRARSAMESG